MEEGTQLIVFTLKNETYGVSIAQVKEIITITGISSLPEMPMFIPGVINLRGKVYIVYDLRARFGFGDRQINKDTKIIVINDKNFGFIVDEVKEIIRVDKENVDKITDLPISLNKKFISGIVKHNDNIIVVLNLNEIIGAYEKTQ
jgi:purine-binding chemotaxis protein CheW